MQSGVVSNDGGEKLAAPANPVVGRDCLEDDQMCVRTL
jgi:hypothetical protein